MDPSNIFFSGAQENHSSNTKGDKYAYPTYFIIRLFFHAFGSFSQQNLQVIKICYSIVCPSKVQVMPLGVSGRAYWPLMAFPLSFSSAHVLFNTWGYMGAVWLSHFFAVANC
jgi:hypothetical protein